MLDLKIINGTIVDGTGQPRRRGDIGVKAGKIIAVGDVTGDARETIDASSLIVAPGFIDAHTHYDAQIFWDPQLSPSCFHGVTTVLGGFCGFSIAPMSADAAPYIRPMLARVEGMPLDTLEKAVPWNSWTSFGEFLDLLEGKVGLNVGFFCGHSAIRRVVMGSRAVGKRATADELARMKSLLATSLREGALGFSTTISPTHSDGDGNPVPSRWADFSELVELARVVRDFEGTGLELLPDLEFDPEVVELMADFSIAGNRPVNWNALAVTGNDPAISAQRTRRLLEVSDFARARGGEVIALTIPGAPKIFMNLHNGLSFDSIPGLWRTLFKLPVAERIERFQDPQVRRQLVEDAESIPEDSPLAFKRDLGSYLVVAVLADSNKVHEGRKVGDIAAQTGRAPIDVMLEIAIADDLLTTFSPDTGGEDRGSYELRGTLWRDDRTLIGASDAGAHLDMIDTFAFSTTTLQHGVRQHGVITLEEAVHCMTDRIARYFGFVDRGRIEVGQRADIVIFDEASVGRGPTSLRHDLPGGAARIYAEATGIPHVFVNGVQIVRDGRHTGALPGSVLRSGKDTHTVGMDALRRVGAAV
jgi:N-acyl-D-aspartate/D-glutamate deacylase